MGLKFGDEREIDHIDGDGLNNQEYNLRICTHTENMRNFQVPIVIRTSKYRGVCWHKSNNGWAANISISNKSRYLGTYSLEIEAAKAYDKAARQHRGDFARTNFEDA